MFKGGFLSGYKTYIMAGIIIVNGFGDWALNGNITLADFVTLLFTDPHIQAGVALITVRLGISKGVAS